MKKLLIAMGCLTAIVLISSCTEDSVESSNTETQKNLNQISLSTPSDTINNLNIEVPDDIDDKNPPRP